MSVVLQNKWIQKSFILLFFLFFLSGCSSLGTYNPATGKNEFILISTEEEVAMGKNVDQNLRSQMQFSSNERFLEKVSKIGRRVADASDRQDYEYNFYVVEKDELNAFTTPGGNIYVFTGLLDKLKTDDQIAAVLAHEIGHCAAKHVVKKFQASLSYDILRNLIVGSFDSTGRAAQIASMSSGTIMNLVFSKYSRKDEFEADKLGVKYMHRSGFGLDGIVETLTILKNESKGPALPVILRSHPYLEERIKRVKEDIYYANRRDQQ